VRRYVLGIFSDRYLTTMGSRSTRRSCMLLKKSPPHRVDLAGEDELTQLRTDYLRGASGISLSWMGLGSPHCTRPSNSSGKRPARWVPFRLFW
jgi:hypothetical protein